MDLMNEAGEFHGGAQRDFIQSYSNPLAG